MSDQVLTENCERCGTMGAKRFQLFSFARFDDANGGIHDELQYLLCANCARLERKQLKSQPALNEGLSREDLISELNRFFDTSGAFDICGRCHQQGTGCCPSTCRIITENGCSSSSKHGKTVFCAAFVCGALLNAISECDAEAGRALKWIKNELGPAEFRVYEMITRVPSSVREPVRPLQLPKRYPHPTGLSGSEKIKEKLASLTEEVLQIRRLWREQEIRESREASTLKPKSG